MFEESNFVITHHVFKEYGNNKISFYLTTKYPVKNIKFKKILIIKDNIIVWNALENKSNLTFDYCKCIFPVKLCFLNYPNEIDNCVNIYPQKYYCVLEIVNISNNKTYNYCIPIKSILIEDI